MKKKQVSRAQRVKAGKELAAQTYVATPDKARKELTLMIKTTLMTLVCLLCVLIGVPGCAGTVAQDATSSTQEDALACSYEYTQSVVEATCQDAQFFITRCATPVASPGSECVPQPGTSSDTINPTQGVSRVWCCR